MRGFIGWASPNLARFVALWAALATAVFAVVEIGHRVQTPSSIGQIVSIPLLLIVVLFVAAFTGFVALLLLLPVVVVWLAVYLIALWWVAPLVDRRAARIVAIALSALPVVFIHGDDPPTVYSMIGVGVLYGASLRLPPTRRNKPDEYRIELIDRSGK